MRMNPFPGPGGRAVVILVVFGSLRNAISSSPLLTCAQYVNML